MVDRTVRAMYIPVDGPVEIIDQFPDDYIAIRDKIGAELIDVASTQRASFYVDDEGLLNGAKYNEKASKLYWANGGWKGNSLWGDVLVFGPVDAEGYDTDVSAQMITDVIADAV